MKELIYDTWIGRGFLTFIFSMLLVYYPYLKNRKQKLSWHLQFILLIMCLIWGKIGFWLMVFVALLNIDELIKSFKH